MELSLTKLFGGSRYLIQSIHAKKLQVRIFSRLGWISPLLFQQISRKSVKVEFLTYHVTRPLIELKLAISKTCSDSFNMGRVCLVSMPVVTLQSFKMIGCVKVG